MTQHRQADASRAGPQHSESDTVLVTGRGNGACHEMRQPRRWLVSRHPGAVEWLHAQGIEADRAVEHLDPEAPAPGDIVIGTLPLHIAARLCERRVRFQFLSLDLPPELRGRELHRDEMKACNARLEEFRIERIDSFAADQSGVSA